MDEKKWVTEDRLEPWEQSSYRTGSTNPPKKHSGLIAVLLAAVILLGGISSALSLMNIRLFHQLASQSDNDSAPVRFSAEQDSSEDSENTVQQTPAVNAPNLTLDLQQPPESVANVPQAGGLSLQEIYSKAIPSVVSISCTSDVGNSSGTGVVLSSDGYIVTNSHVIEDAQACTVLLTDGRSFSAAVVGADAVSDLAVLYISATDLTPAVFGNSGALQVGDAVVAIGDPLGVELRGTMTDGIVSAINRDLTTGGRTMTLIQTNAALNAGNSGGPLLNCYGQVVGINTMKIGDYMSSAGVEGLGFAIPSSTVKEVVDQLIAQGYVSGRPSLGLTGVALSTRDMFIAKLPMGIYITEVAPESDAANKGISPGDILLSFDNVRITDLDTLKSQLYTHKPGDSVSVVIYRGGVQYTLTLTVEETD